MPSSPLPSTPSLHNAPAPHLPASISPIVDTAYRIQLDDLAGATRQVEIANVTFQGVEALAPVLHFQGQTKRLVMTPEQVAQMVEITGTVLMARWIGTKILLHPHTQGDEQRIEIRAVTARHRGRAMPTYVSEDTRGWIVSASVVGLILCASLVALLLNPTVIGEVWQLIVENLPVR